MQRIITLVAVLVVNFMVNAQATSEEIAIKKTIDTFFEGLHKGDSTIVVKTLHPSIKMQTTFTNKEGKKVLVTETKDKVLTSIAAKKPEDTYLEKLLLYDIKIDGNLASVWTPYEFYYNNNFSHCGANSFQLFNNNGTWQIIYIVDMRRHSNCNPSN
ncbi:nuclear transport factor 2 family protein [Tenacibaculum sp. IB213877]|uniref:nuclear transport factor 2 family protein n=1 Tax=Tenacibaculum sp. IB213877 TaxID=3097351 RepID=UPI002A5AD726|nr:nuclear transport factor 2 family protein [Tenacibaculum sp. IB213877]MDY0781264.1 nuclear transport factor 2 family protein [Tenacibaculum sp. IB213877]